jgi:5-hydroxyisourate hydrolase-like protein (transthyretin family)
MDDMISKVDNGKVNNIEIEVSAENNKTEYRQCNDKVCAVEILENDKEEIKNQKSVEIENKLLDNGEIVVTSVLDCGEHEFLQGVKINLYKINGLSPVLIKSQLTNEKGTVVFSEIAEGCYRIIEIVDKRYFEKPKYINWNEIIIDSENKKQKVIIVNKIKRFASQNKHKH